MTWRDRLKIHPICNKLPLMTPEKLTAFREDIVERGLIYKVVVRETPDGLELLDGRNRLDALEGMKLGCGHIYQVDIDGTHYDPDIFEVVTINDDQVAAYIISINVHRRHLDLTNEQTRELISELLKADPSQSDRTVAKIVKRDHKTVGAVRTKLEASGEIPQTKTRTDTKGHQRPAHQASQKQAGQSAADRKQHSAEQEAATATNIMPLEIAPTDMVPINAGIPPTSAPEVSPAEPYDEDWPDLPPPNFSSGKNGKRLKVSDEEVMANTIMMLKLHVEGGIKHSEKLGRLPQFFDRLRKYIDRMEAEAAAEFAQEDYAGEMAPTEAQAETESSKPTRKRRTKAEREHATQPRCETLLMAPLARPV
jgi:hypothetical protein